MSRRVHNLSYLHFREILDVILTFCKVLQRFPNSFLSTQTGSLKTIAVRVEIGCPAAECFMQNLLPPTGFPGMKTVTKVYQRSTLASSCCQDSWGRLSDIQDPWEPGCSRLWCLLDQHLRETPKPDRSCIGRKEIFSSNTPPPPPPRHPYHCRMQLLYLPDKIKWFFFTFLQKFQNSHVGNRNRNHLNQKRAACIKNVCAYM